MNRRLLLGPLAGLVLVLTSVVLPGSASAQDLTGPAQQLSPILELISPIAWPVCGDAVLVTVAPAALGVTIPPELAALFGPLIILCGAVPQPDGQRVCALDTAAQDALAQVSKALLGSALPLLLTPTDGVAGELVLVGDLVPQLNLPIEATVDAVLSCNPPKTDADTTTTVAAGAAPGGTIPSTSTSTTEAVAAAPTFADLRALPPLLPPTTPLPVAVPVRTPTKTPIVLISQPRFRYPVVMGLPLVLIVLGAFLARALTRPLRPTRKGP
jgi:hypothetical protein